MAYDPKTGEWKPEDSSVSKRLTGLLSKDNDYLRKAGTVGRQAANRRGLINSTMAVEAVESARIGAALPIASQEAGQAHQREIQGRQLQSTDVLQGRDIESRERIQERDIRHQRGLQSDDIASRERMQRHDLDTRLTLQDRDIEQNQWLAQFDRGTRLHLEQLDIGSRERIAALNVSTSERGQASSLAASFESTYANLLQSIMNNPDIPAGVRQDYMDHAANIRDSNLALVEQLYNFNLEWAP